MGKKKRGSNQRGTMEKMADAVSDDEAGAPSGNDHLYDEVDKWANDKDAILLEATKKSKKGGKKETASEMFALSGTDSDSDLELPVLKKKKKKKADNIVEDDDIAEDYDDEEDVRAWGNKKKQFYGGNQGDVYSDSELGSDMDEDKAEEREAEILQLKQLSAMDEEDFLDTFATVAKTPKEKKIEALPEDAAEDNIKRDISKLSRKEQLALFKQTSPEFEGIILDFQSKMAEATTKLAPIVSLADAGSLPPGPAVDFVRAKLHLVLNYCVNILSYLMFKTKGTNLKLHPVTGRLVQFKQMFDSLQEMEAIVMPQVDSLITLMESGQSIDTVVKEEKRRQKRKTKKNLKTEKLNVLKNSTENQEEEEEVAKKKNKKQKLNTMEGLTGDEQIAVEFYKSIRKNKDLESESSDEEVIEKEDDNDETAIVGKEDEEEDEEKRGITYQIAKNKGLVPKRSKLQRNPRVKHRVKYAKAKVKRKGAVREVRTETKRYDGEMFGINARVKKGVKIQ